MAIKLQYIANIRFPTERAHGIQVAHMCAAFARGGADVTLLVPNRKTFNADPFQYYGIERNFRIEKIPVPDVVKFGGIGFLIESFIFARRAAKRAGREPDALIYTREELPFMFLPSGRVFYEAHQLRQSYLLHRLIRRAKRVISISHGLKDALVKSGISEDRILVAHDGFDEKQFAQRISREEARKRLKLPQDKKIAMYIGGLEPWKGAQTLYKAATYLATDGILTAIIGGTDEKIKEFQSHYPAVRFLGARPYRELPVNQQAADVLVIPNSGHYELSGDFASPLKLFAHMVSGVPLVVARVPALTEILTPAEACFFESDTPESLSVAVKEALNVGVHMMAKAAMKKAQAFTWDNRAKQVIDFCLRV